MTTPAQASIIHLIAQMIPAAMPIMRPSLVSCSPDRSIVPAAIARVHRAAPFDLLRVHSLRFIGPSALWARRRHRLDVPIVAHHHHLDASPLNRVIEKRVVAGVDRVIVGSEFARRQLAAELGVRTDHVVVVPYGVDARFAPRPPRPDLHARYGLRKGPVALFFGGLKPRKNVPVLLDVWARVQRSGGSARLLIAGGGPMLKPLQARARSLGIADSVVFTGYVAEQDKAAHYNLADVFVFPSAMEGFGLAVAEAMASGLPVVASDRGSLPELLAHGEGGFLCDPSAPAAMADALHRLLSDATLRREFSAANLERAHRTLRWDTCVRRTREVYEETIATWHGPRVTSCIP